MYFNTMQDNTSLRIMKDILYKIFSLIFTFEESQYGDVDITFLKRRYVYFIILKIVFFIMVVSLNL